jgi:hypothetical protein
MMTVFRRLAVGVVVLGLLGVVGCAEDNEKNAMEGSKDEGPGPNTPPAATSSEDYYNKMKGQQTTYGPGNPMPKAAPAAK